MIESKYALGISESVCDENYLGEVDILSLSEEDKQDTDSECSEPVTYVDPDDGLRYYFSSCLSRPFTLTPGGIIAQSSIVHYPFPRDHRVILGTRMWEFVQGPELAPVYVNQLYVHHMLGDIIKGNGAEGIRRSDDDARFPSPYGKLSGDFDNVMTFHLIDLREVPEEARLECLECRCAGDFLTGRVGCCTNCTSLETPTVDYRLRYNVTWSEVSDFVEYTPDRMVRPITTLYTDVAHAVDKYIEFDVPHYSELPAEHRHPDNPQWQRLAREGTVRTLFSHSYPPNRPNYEGADQLEIFRCTAHLHIGGLEIYLEDAVTGEVICRSEATYGTDPATDLGFLTSMSVINFDPQNPRMISADQPLRLVSVYNATEVHGGVMGHFDLDVAEVWHGNVGQQEAALTVDLCQKETCDVDQVPNWCRDNLEDTFSCRDRGICDCKDDLLANPFLPGCGEILDTGRYGQYEVDSICAESCGCKAEPKLVVTNLQMQIKETRRQICRYNTKECQDYLSNLYSCSQPNTPGVENLDQVVRSLMREHGTLMVQEYAKIGNPFMHTQLPKKDEPGKRKRHLQQQALPACLVGEVVAESEDESDSESAEEESSATNSVVHGFVYVVLALAVAIL
jgi:hypothetical protein